MEKAALDTLIAVITGGGIAALSSGINQWMSGRTTLKLMQLQKKLDFLQSAQDKTIKLFDNQVPYITSMDSKDIIESTRICYQSKKNFGLKDAQELVEHRSLFMKDFFQFRHLLPQNIRKECDIYFKHFFSQLKNLNEGDLLAATIEEQRNVFVTFRTLIGLFYLGIIKGLEETSDEMKK